MRVLSLCSGIGGFDLGLDTAVLHADDRRRPPTTFWETWKPSPTPQSPRWPRQSAAPSSTQT
jgi:hypothetical protein